MREFKRVRLDGKGDDIINMDGKGDDIFFERPKSSFGSEELEDKSSLWGSEDRYSKPESSYEYDPTDFMWKNNDPAMKYRTGVKPVPASFIMISDRWLRDTETGVKPVPANFTWGQSAKPSKYREREWAFDE